MTTALCVFLGLGGFVIAMMGWAVVHLGDLCDREMYGEDD
jgi:hypothetical protein